jgi:hypothetical protein
MSQNKGLAPFVIEVIQIVSRKPSPLMGRVGRVSGRGGGSEMLIGSAVAKALTPYRARPPPRTPPHEGEGTGWRFVQIIKITGAHSQGYPPTADCPNLSSASPTQCCLGRGRARRA